MNDWPKYESHKIIQAAKIIGITDSGVILIDPFDDRNAIAFEPTVPGMAEKAEIGGYAVLYPDGFKSISPAKAFEEDYTRVSPADPD